MVTQGTILRIFKTIRILSKRARTINYVAAELGCSTRTVYRYINLMEEIGVSVDQKLITKNAKTRWSGRWKAFNKCPCCGKDL